MVGLAGASISGLLYLLSLSFLSAPRISIGVLLAGRAVLGAAESFIITGATTWGLARVGTHNAGKVIAWVGTAMFAALAVGAPLGTTLYQKGGFGAVSSAAALAPLVTLILIAPLRPATLARRSGQSLLSVAKRIWLPGLGAALSSIGFSAIATFSSLLFAGNGWTPVWLAFSAYAASLIVARIGFGHLPDRLGGARVALWFVLIETAGLILMWLAAGVAVATTGAALTGFGYALVFPALGVEAVRRAPPENRGIAMGAYTACLDVALGGSGPALGAIASRTDLSSVFLASAVVVFGAAFIASRLLRARSTIDEAPQ
jgi:MFS family permease